MDQQKEDLEDANSIVPLRRESVRQSVQQSKMESIGSQNKPQAYPRRKPTPHESQENLPARLKEMEEALSREREMRQQAEQDLEVSNQKANEYCMYWKDSAGELNKYLARGQGFQTVEDKVFREDTIRLRMKIRDLAILKFDKEIVQEVDFVQEVDSSVKKISHQLQITIDSVLSCVLCRHKRPLIIQAYIWTLLLCDIFDQFRWSPRMYEMSKLLRPAVTDDFEAKRRFQVWKATTSTFIHDSTGEGSIPPEELNRKSERIYSSLKPFTARRKGGILNEIEGIIEGAVRLDMKIHMQASEMSWYWRSGKLLFDERIMKLEWGDANTARDQPISFVFAPALIRKGTLNSDDFDEEELLLPMLATTDQIENIPPEKARRGRDLPPWVTWLFKPRIGNLITN